MCLVRAHNACTRFRSTQTHTHTESDMCCHGSSESADPSRFHISQSGETVDWPLFPRVGYLWKFQGWSGTSPSEWDSLTGATVDDRD